MLLFLIILIVSALHAQDRNVIETDTLLANAYKGKGNQFLQAAQLDSSLFYFNKAVPLYRKHERWEAYAWGQLSIAVCFYYQNRMDSSEIHLESIVETAQRQSIDNDDLWGNVRNLLSILYANKGDYNEAIVVVKKDISRLGRKASPTAYDSSTIANYHNSLGAWYSQKEDYNRALDHLLKTAFLRKQLGAPIEDLLIINNNLGNVLSLKGDYTSSIRYFKKNIALIVKANKEKAFVKSLKRCYNGLATCYRKSHKIDSALYFARLAVQTAPEYQQLLALAKLGHVHLSNRAPEKAREAFAKAEALFLAEAHDREQTIVSIYNGLAEASLMKKNYEQTLSYLKRALDHNLLAYDPNATLSTSIRLSNVRRPDLLLNTLHLRAQRLAAQRDSPQAMEEALSAYRQSTDWIDSIRLNLASESSHLFWRNKLKDIYGEAIAAAHQLYLKSGQKKKYLEEALVFSEKSRGILLLESRKTRVAKGRGEIADSLFQREIDLKIDIAFFQKKLSAEKEEDKKQRYQNFLATSRLQLAALKEKINLEYRQIAEGSQDFRTTIAPIKEELLQESEVFIEYFFSTQGLFAFCISDGEEQFLRLADASVCSQAVEAFTQNLYHPEAQNIDVKNAIENYNRTAYGLYQLVLQAMIKSLPGSTKRFYIIPDGPLSSLPFGPLTNQAQASTSTDFSRLAYLAKQYQFVYAYSYHLLQDHLQRKTIVGNNQSCLAFAPQHEGTSNIAQRNREALSRSELAALEGPAEEIKAIRNHFSGDFKFGGEATKAAFLDRVEQYGLLHLATHGISNFEQPELAHFLFSPAPPEDHRLYLYEISQLDLKAQLAVLSACETGRGKYEQGEGQFSLARGFMEAGVPTVVMSLWKVDDWSTSELMPHFYANLADGLTIDAALNNAQLHYLSEAPLQFRHPYYWSGFVALGAPQALQKQNSLPRYLLFAGLGLLLFMLLTFRRNRVQS